MSCCQCCRQEQVQFKHEICGKFFRNTVGRQGAEGGVRIAVDEEDHPEEIWDMNFPVANFLHLLSKALDLAPDRGIF